jgi:hypothetical protein
MASSGGDTKEIADAIKDSLEKRGVLDSVKATIKAEVMKSFTGENNEPKINTDPVVYLGFEIVKDFLLMTNMTNTLDVLRDECGLQENALDRDMILHELGLTSRQSSVPLLALLVDELKAAKAARARR